ncbi:MAG: HAD family hydrolase [Candidatus Hodarchaeales archaeon]|jgi:HAD superfamily hydrolase (TIGR01509 family)
MKIECIVFDVDGTIVDNTKLIVQLFQDVVKKYLGKSMSIPDVLALWGPPGDEIFRNIFPSDKLEPAWQEFLQRYYTSHPTTGFFSKDQFISIRKHVPQIAIFTGKSKKTLEISLEKLGITECFDLILTGSDVVRSKPFPDALFQIIATLNLNKEEILFIGDSHLDVIAGKAAGIKTAAALWGTVESQKLLDSGPDYIFQTPTEFIDFLTRAE